MWMKSTADEEYFDRRVYVYGNGSDIKLPGVNFINILCTNFLYECCFGSFFYIHVTREKLPKRHLYKKFVRKILMKFKVGLSTITATLCES